MVRKILVALTITCLVCLAYGDTYEASHDSSEEYQDYPDFGIYQYQQHPSNAPPRLVLPPQPRKFAPIPPIRVPVMGQKVPDVVTYLTT
nr:unnamed protein product [Callosobruchus analis]